MAFSELRTAAMLTPFLLRTWVRRSRRTSVLIQVPGVDSDVKGAGKYKMEKQDARVADLEAGSSLFVFYIVVLFKEEL